MALGPRGHNHVWQEAQHVLWGLRMVGDRLGVAEEMGVTSCAVLLTLRACGYRDLRLCLNPGSVGCTFRCQLMEMEDPDRGIRHYKLFLTVFGSNLLGKVEGWS